MSSTAIFSATYPLFLHLPLSPSDVSADERKLTKAIISAFDTCAPLRSIILSSRRKPWVSPQIRSLMRTRDHAYRTARTLGSAADVQIFRAARATISNALNSAKNLYISTRLEKAVSPQAKWKEIRRLRVTGANTPSPFRYLDASTLNTHYAAIVNRHPPITEPLYDSIVQRPLRTDVNRVFHLRPVSQAEVLQAINRSTSKATGLDGLSTQMLKLASTSALNHLTSLVNSSIINSIFPDEWKKALIRPLAKTKTPLLPSDTRPIAVLSEYSKVLERLVHAQLSGYLEVHNLLHERQAGFRRGHSTQTALLGVLEDVRQAIDNRMLTIIILFDFSEAFDCISHTRLLAKLKALNMSDHTLRWFFSYLADRLQAVIDEGGSISDWLRASSGVPQGSVLGPLLFAIYINDLPAALSFARVMIYADDTQVYLHFTMTDIIQAIAPATTDAQAVANWARENGLLLNHLKTKVMILGSEFYTTRLDLATLPRVTIDGQALPYVTEARNLGVIISPTLDWKRHTSEITRRVYSTLHTLRFHRHSLSRSLRKTLVESLVLPRFDYACVVYHHLDNTRIKKIQVTLKACVRFIVGRLPFLSHITPHLLSLHWLSALRRREFFICTLAYSVVANDTPISPSVSADARLIDVTVRRSDRRPPQPFVPHTPRTEAYKHSFTLEAMSLLNTLNVIEFSPAKLQAFRQHLFNTLFARDMADWARRVRDERLSARLLNIPRARL